ncbi:hypothetical protein JCGZ_08839 [Jatropha curcas]|uniref:Uncharacterized protein n=1 Tax=Jatropha curcas TaxID=180498 RepID=A0A067KVB0_JATCU|nr:hypothetical protein JCGZ_08839 [Jatropha curcas]
MTQQQQQSQLLIPSHDHITWKLVCGVTETLDEPSSYMAYPLMMCASGSQSPIHGRPVYSSLENPLIVFPFPLFFSIPTGGYSVVFHIIYIISSERANRDLDNDSTIHAREEDSVSWCLARGPRNAAADPQCTVAGDSGSFGRIDRHSHLHTTVHGGFNSFHQIRRFLDGKCSHKREELIGAHLEAINRLNRAKLSKIKGWKLSAVTIPFCAVGDSFRMKGGRENDRRGFGNQSPLTLVVRSHLTPLPPFAHSQSPAILPRHQHVAAVSVSPSLPLCSCSGERKSQRSIGTDSALRGSVAPQLHCCSSATPAIKNELVAPPTSSRRHHRSAVAPQSFSSARSRRYSSVQTPLSPFGRAAAPPAIPASITAPRDLSHSRRLTSRRSIAALVSTAARFG